MTKTFVRIPSDCFLKCQFSPYFLMIVTLFYTKKKLMSVLSVWVPFKVDKYNLGFRKSPQSTKLSVWLRLITAIASLEHWDWKSDERRSSEFFPIVPHQHHYDLNWHNEINRVINAERIQRANNAHSTNFEGVLLCWSRETTKLLLHSIATDIKINKLEFFLGWVICKTQFCVHD